MITLKNGVTLGEDMRYTEDGLTKEVVAQVFGPNPPSTVDAFCINPACSKPHTSTFGVWRDRSMVGELVKIGCCYFNEQDTARVREWLKEGTSNAANTEEK